jgi:hypothetical protein
MYNLGGLRSVNHNQSITLTFLNKTKSAVNIVWINYNGGRQLYRTLASNQSFSQPSYVTHPWLITDGPGHCLGAFVALQSQGVVIKEPEEAAADWGIRAAYDAVGTWNSLNNPTFDCFRKFNEYDMKKTNTAYFNAVIFCTTLVSIIGYDRKATFQ